MANKKTAIARKIRNKSWKTKSGLNTVIEEEEEYVESEVDELDQEDKIEESGD